MDEISQNEWLQAQKLEDYRTCFESMRHEDDRKAQLLTTFFLIQSVLGAFFGWAAEKNILVAVVIAAFAAACGLFWYLIMERLRGFTDLRYEQLKQMEGKFEGIQTISYELELRRTGQVRDLHYELKSRQTIFSVSKHVESLLPLLVSGIWGFIFAIGVLDAIDVVNIF
jgi:hypothetical protein